MNRIHLKNIKVFTNHGCLVEEEKIGSEYIVNVTVEANLQEAAISDSLSDTVDYVLLNHIVKEEMAIRSKLLEHVARRIVNRIFTESTAVETIFINVAKVNPPIGGDVESVAVEMEVSRNMI